MPPLIFIIKEGCTFTLVDAKGEYKWYEDKPDERYPKNPTVYEVPEEPASGVTYLAAEIPLDWEEIETEEGAVTVFKISDAEDLAAFRDIVNGRNGMVQNNKAWAVLTQDITIYENLEGLLDEDGNPLEDSGVVSWEPIGTNQYVAPLTGTAKPSPACIATSSAATTASALSAWPCSTPSAPAARCGT